ncbi:uncharacterized protein LOC110366545 isoform X2 [Fundulus heteroclitus]|uniref:uncharacterized protein LOC110366545 isoform X2 n=1 Tax=Fundulus heteroclitus TaxID=8078 RepID=UPI00165CD77E|nr:uncharacterized protein LOC110366545 isoform X2 [Fundulus heteroclitus]
MASGERFYGMEFIWLYSLCQCTLSLFVIVVSVRLCVAVSSSGRAVADIQQGAQGVGIQPGSVSSCLRLCLGCVGAVGGAVGVPVTLLLNLRTPQCLYTCMTLVCCPLLIRQFTMFLLMLLTLDAHLQHHLADRYSSVVTRRRALCAVLLCWLGSVLSSFAQFIGSDVLSSFRSDGSGLGPEGHGLEGNWTTSLPPLTSTPVPKYFQDRKIYTLVPPILFTPPRKQVGEPRASFQLAAPNLQSSLSHSKGKSVHMALREAMQTAPWSSAKHSFKAKGCPEV